MEKRFATHIKGEQILFKHASGRSAERGREVHEYHEIIWVMGGDVEFFSEALHTPMMRDQIVLIPKEIYHQFVIRGDEESYHRCVFSFYDLPELSELIARGMRKVRIMDMTPDLRSFFEQAVRTAESARASDEEKRAVIRSVLTLLICNLAQGAERVEATPEKKPASIVSRCVEYINGHLSEPLTVAGIAKELNVSPSLLSHTFKNEMNIAPYR